MKQLVDAVSVPVLANGDFYDPEDISTVIRSSGCAGVMMGRPVLLNPSIFRFRQIDEMTGACVYRYNFFLPLLDTIKEYIRMCSLYDAPYQVRYAPVSIPI